ncbi:hypothetical protein EJ04DRAFT_128058 [Polyplosphaeria fusca]|uniref:Uncharacterized protein n=1 Tax=Polyplosphaeria fusca TaxID=682080 RepID=A0A9P4UV33_9PLEO|nr:hypothetical protein EJ04DRAFT_128058 [Polyplosphaeria fusca]
MGMRRSVSALGTQRCACAWSGLASHLIILVVVVVVVAFIIAFLPLPPPSTEDITSSPGTLIHLSFPLCRNSIAPSPCRLGRSWARPVGGWHPEVSPHDLIIRHLINPPLHVPSQHHAPRTLSSSRRLLVLSVARRVTTC